MKDYAYLSRFLLIKDFYYGLCKLPWRCKHGSHGLGTLIICLKAEKKTWTNISTCWSDIIWDKIQWVYLRHPYKDSTANDTGTYHCVGCNQRTKSVPLRQMLLSEVITEFSVYILDSLECTLRNLVSALYVIFFSRIRCRSTRSSYCRACSRVWTCSLCWIWRCRLYLRNQKGKDLDCV